MCTKWQNHTLSVPPSPSILALDTLAKRRENSYKIFANKGVSNVKKKKNFRRNVKPQRMEQ